MMMHSHKPENLINFVEISHLNQIELGLFSFHLRERFIGNCVWHIVSNVSSIWMSFIIRDCISIQMVTCTSCAQSSKCAKDEKITSFTFVIACAWDLFFCSSKHEATNSTRCSIEICAPMILITEILNLQLSQVLRILDNPIKMSLAH